MISSAGRTRAVAGIKWINLCLGPVWNNRRFDVYAMLYLEQAAWYVFYIDKIRLRECNVQIELPL
jgi:hypothetical protein